MPILEVNNIRKSFLKRNSGWVNVLNGIDFSLEKGEVVSIIGSSGSGKTTLLRCINFLERADEGVIKVDGDVVYDASRKNLTGEQLRRNQLNFGLVFQSFNLFPQYSAIENVMLAPKLLAKDRPDFKVNKKQILSDIRKTAEELLTRVGLEDRMNNFPCELSGGQQQRVSIARALALNPKVLFFDEPTSALDPELTGEILRVIRSLAEKKVTMVIVTHEIEFAKNVSDRIIFLADGVIVEDGPPSQVIDNPAHPKTQAFLRKMNEK